MMVNKIYMGFGFIRGSLVNLLHSLLSSEKYTIDRGLGEEQRTIIIKQRV